MQDMRRTDNQCTTSPSDPQSFDATAHTLPRQNPLPSAYVALHLLKALQGPKRSPVLCGDAFFIFSAVHPSVGPGMSRQPDCWLRARWCIRCWRNLSSRRLNMEPRLCWESVLCGARSASRVTTPTHSNTPRARTHTHTHTHKLRATRHSTGQSKFLLGENLGSEVTKHPRLDPPSKAPSCCTLCCPLTGALKPRQSPVN